MRCQVTCEMFIVWSVQTMSRKWYFQYLTQTIHSNSKILFPWRKNCLSKFPWCAAHILLFLIFFKETLCVSAHVSKLLSWTMLTLCQEKCYLSVVMFAPWRWDCWSVYPQFYLTKKKTVNFWFNGKILSLLIDIQSVYFQSSAQLQNVSFS